MRGDPPSPPHVERFAKCVPFAFVAAYLTVPLLIEEDAMLGTWRSFYEHSGAASCLLPLMAGGGAIYLAGRGGAHIGTSWSSAWSSLVAPALAAAVGALLQGIAVHQHPYGVDLVFGDTRLSAECVSEALPIGTVYGLLASAFFATLAVQWGMLGCGGGREGRSSVPPGAAARSLALESDRVGILGRRPTHGWVSRESVRWARVGLGCIGVAVVLASAGPGWAIAGALSAVAGILGVQLAQLLQESPSDSPSTDAAGARRRVLWGAGLAIVSSALAVRSVLYSRIFVAIAGESVPPWERSQRILDAHHGLLMLGWAYPALFVLLLLGAPASTRRQPAPQRWLRSTGRLQGLLWISTCVLALLFLYGKADEQLGVIQSLRRGQSVVPVIPDLRASQRASGALSR